MGKGSGGGLDFGRAEYDTVSTGRYCEGRRGGERGERRGERRRGEQRR